MAKSEAVPQSLSAVYVHLVFSTKDRSPTITDTYREDLLAYIGGTARGLGCLPLCVGGVSDHVHLLVRISRTISIADLVRDVKSHSCLWMKARTPEFAWQAGYGAFSFGEGDLARLRSYVADQQDHHRKWSFQDEYRSLLREHGLEWDERYLWE